MKLTVDEHLQQEVCPFCRDDFEHGDAHICKNCSTLMHVECFQENGGCAVSGCNERTENWPRCSQCNEQLKKLSAVICIRCGYDQKNQRYLNDAPSSQGTDARQETRVVLENPKTVDWDLPTEDDVQTATPGLFIGFLEIFRIATWIICFIAGIKLLKTDVDTGVDFQTIFTTLIFIVFIYLARLSGKLLDDSKKSHS